jgi:hypothetical protein
MRRALLLGLLVLPAAFPASAAALAVAPAPTNPSSACAVGNPCSLNHAVQVASPGDDIVIAPGAYSLTFQRNLFGVDVHGIPGQPAPQIVETANAAFSISDGELRHVGVTQSGPAGLSGVSLGNGGAIEDAVIRCTSDCHAVIGALGTTSIKDTVATGPTTIEGIEVTGTGVVLRNVTVLVGGSGSHGIQAYTNGNDASIDMRNSIVRGAGADLAFIRNGGTIATLTYGWSDVRAGTEFVSGGGSIVDLGHNVREEPIRIVDQAGGDVHLREDSSLIDAGTADLLGTVDLDGQARTIGTAPDIGADEAFFAPPGAETGEASAIDQTSAAVAGVVTPAGHATSYRFEWGTTTAYGSATADATAGNGSQAVPVNTALSGLAPDTVYHYRVVATSAYGTSAGIDRVLRTAAAPDAAPPAPFTGLLAPTKSVRLDKRGRFFVTLLCPATATTGCSGTARLGLPLAKPVMFTAAAGASVRVRLKLTKTGRRLVGKKGLRTTLVVLATDASGREHATAGTLKIRRAKKHR